MKKVCSAEADMITFIMPYNLPNIQNIEENVDLLFCLSRSKCFGVLCILPWVDHCVLGRLYILSRRRW